MTAGNNKSNILNLLGVPLSRRGWVYLLSLLVPLVVYDLSLKAASVASIPELTTTFDLMWSAVFFNLGYALFWIGLFAAVRGRELPRRVVAVLFQVITMLVIIVTTFAHHYFQQTGATLDYATLAEWVPKLDEVGPSLFQREVPPSARVLLAATLLYAALGPPLLTRAVGRWQRWPRTSPTVTARTSFLSPLALFLLSVSFGSLSFLPASVLRTLIPPWQRTGSPT